MSNNNMGPIKSARAFVNAFAEAAVEKGVKKVRKLSGTECQIIFKDGSVQVIEFKTLESLAEFRQLISTAKAEAKAKADAVADKKAKAEKLEPVGKKPEVNPMGNLQGVTFDKPKEEEKPRKSTPLEEAAGFVEFKRLSGSLEERVEQVKALFSPEDFKALHDVNDPMLRQGRSADWSEVLSLIEQCCSAPEAISTMLYDKFGNMAWEAGVAYGSLVAPGGFAPEMIGGKVVFKKLADDQIGLNATDKLAAAVLFIQLLGIMSSQRYQHEENVIQGLTPIVDGNRQPLGARPLVFMPMMNLGHAPMHPILEIGDKPQYDSLVKMLSNRISWYNPEVLGLDGYLDVCGDEATLNGWEVVKELSAGFYDKIRAYIKGNNPSMKVSAKKVARVARQVVSQLGNKYLVAQALDAYGLTKANEGNPQVKTLCSLKGWQLVKLLFLSDTPISELMFADVEEAATKVEAALPLGLAVCDNPVVYPMDYAMTYEECVFFLEMLAANSPKSSILDKFVAGLSVTRYDDYSELKLNDYKFVINADDEVYEADREIYIRNQLMVSPLVESGYGHAKEEDIALVNPYGVLVYGILNSLNLACSAKGSTTLAYNSSSPRWGDLYTALIGGETIPVDAEEESGGSTKGDRGLWNHYVTKPFTWNGGLAWYFGHAKPQSMGQRKFVSSLDCVTTAARKKYNLAHLPKGNAPLIDGRLAWLSLPGTLNKKLRERYAAAVLFTLTGIDDLYKAVCFVFPEIEFIFDHKGKAISWGLDNFLVALSTKSGKVLKRIGHKFAKHAEPLGPNADDEALVMYGWNEPSLVHSVNAAWAPFAIAPAGQSDRIMGSNDPFLLKSSYVCEKKGTMDFNVKVEGKTAIESKHSQDRHGKDILVSETINFAVDENVMEGGTDDKPWAVKGVFVRKGETVLELFYKTVEGEKATQLITCPQDCILQEIIISTTMWQQTKVKLRYHMVQSNGKLRGNLKTTVVFSGKALLYNRMNEIYCDMISKNIELLICGDADKSKDLAMGIMEMVAQTLRETAEGRNIIKVLNSPLGLEDDRHLYWSYHLAALGLYDGVLRDFHGEFLRPVWLQRTDVPNNYIRGVREAYANKAGTATAPGKSGWYRITLTELEAYLSTLSSEGHCFPSNAENFHIFTNGLADRAEIRWSKGTATVECGEILVFYSVDDVDFMWQRTPAFTGYEVKGITKHVKVPCKPEISTVDQAAGNLTRCMNTVYRVISSGMKDAEGNYIFVPNPELADQLAENTATSINRWAAFQAMAKGLTIAVRAPKHEDGVVKTTEKYAIEVPMFGIVDDESKIQSYGFSKEVRALIEERLNANQQKAAFLGKLSLTEMARAFWDVVFVFTSKGNKRDASGNATYEKVKIYLPALVSQDAEPTTTESLSGLVKHAFELCLTNAVITVDTGRSLSVRLKAAIRKMIESKKALKKVNQGRRSAQCKAQALPGIPTGEFWVLRTEENTPYSVYNGLVKAFAAIGFKLNINGAYVLCTRSPIPFPAVLKIVLKDKPSAEQVALAERCLQGDLTVNMSVAEAQAILAAFSLQPSQGGFSPLAAQVSGGDNDGDIYVFTPILEGLDALTFEAVNAVIKSRTGFSMVAKEQGGYLVDHCWVKKWSPSSIANPSLISLTNVQGFSRVQFKDFELEQYGLSADSPAAKIRACDGYDVLAERAMQTFSPNVGIAHGMATRAEAASGLFQAMLRAGAIKRVSNLSAFELCLKLFNAAPQDNAEIFIEYMLLGILVFNIMSFKDKALSFTNNETRFLASWVEGEVALPMYEYYEGNPLGGLSFYGFCMTEALKFQMYGSPVAQYSDLNWKDTVAEAGMNPEFAERFLDVAAWCGYGHAYSQGKLVIPADDHCNTMRFLVIGAELVHLIGRGQFAPGYVPGPEGPVANSHLQMAAYFRKWGGAQQVAIEKRLCQESPIFNFLYHYIKVVTRLVPNEAGERVAAHCAIGGRKDLANLARLNYSELMAK